MKKISIILLCIAVITSSHVWAMEHAATQTQNPQNGTAQLSDQKTYRQQIYTWVRENPFVTIASAAIIVALLKERIQGAIQGALTGFAHPEVVGSLSELALLVLKKEGDKQAPINTEHPAENEVPQ